MDFVLATSVFILICMTIPSTADNQKQQIVLRTKAYHVSQTALTSFDCNLKLNIDIALISTFHQAPPFMVVQKDDDGNVKIKGVMPEHLNLLAHALGDARYETTFFK